MRYNGFVTEKPSCRTQFVQHNGYNSSSKYFKCGVPQGSILGPLLFLLYINDLCNVSKALDFILFADDTNIFFSRNDPNENEVLFLGVILNEHLSWKSQIQNVARKVSKSVGIIYKSSFCLNKTSLSTPYYSIVYITVRVLGAQLISQILSV